MKMSNRTLVKTINGLLSFKNNGVRERINAIYAINRNMEMLDKAAIPFQESRNELIEKYFNKKKNGDIVPKKGMEQNLESELGELLYGIEADVDIYKIPISLIENIEASELEFEAISMMLEESGAEKA